MTGRRRDARGRERVRTTGRPNRHRAEVRAVPGTLALAYWLDNDRRRVRASGVAMSRSAAPNTGQLKAVGST